DWGGGLANVDLSDIDLFTSNLTFPANVTNFNAFDSFIADGFGNEMMQINQTGGGAFGLSFGGINAPPGGTFANGQVPGNPSSTQLQQYLSTITSGAAGFGGVPAKDALGHAINSLANNTTVFGASGGPYFVVFRNQLAQTDVPRFFGYPTAGTQLS